MTTKEVWELLETEPTCDKRKIKHAYARAVKKYHPEENPEEFQKVYAAYQQALAFAETIGEIQVWDTAGLHKQAAGQNQTAAESGAPESVQDEQAARACNEEQERIQKMFRDMRNEHEKKLSIFRHKWQWYLKHQKSDSAKREMLAYTQTHWFMDIKDDIRQLSVWKGNKIRNQELLHLLENEQEQFLYQNIEKWKNMAHPPDKKNRNLKNFQKAFGFILILIAVVLVNAFIYYVPKNTGSSMPDRSIDTEWEKEEVLAFLQETYPMAEFTEAEPFQKEYEEYTLYDKYKVYEDSKEYEDGNKYLIKVADSDISVHAYVVYKDNSIYIWEDFGKQYMRQLAEKWDIMCDLCYIPQPWDDGNSHYLMLGYFEMNKQLDLKGFMERFREFAQSREVREFTNIEGVSFSVADCFMPTAFLMDAGEMPTPLLYDFADLPEAEDMAEDMGCCIAEYYMHMEPWQFENEPEYEEWVKWYEERVQNLKAAPATPEGSAVVTTAGDLGVQVVVYQKGVFDYISTGDMYRLAKKAGVPVTVLDSGEGFALESGSCCYAGGILCMKVIEILTEE